MILIDKQNKIEFKVLEIGLHVFEIGVHLFEFGIPLFEIQLYPVNSHQKVLNVAHWCPKQERAFGACLSKSM